MNIDINDVISIVKSTTTITENTICTISQKGGYSNIVTSCDIEIQNYLCARLETLIPGCGFLCEEGDSELTQGKDYIWIIDPIDGTANFSRGISDCCVSVALKAHGEVVLGVVYNQYKDELYYAEKGKGAYLNGEKLAVSDRVFEDGLLCTAMSLYNKQYAKVCSDIIYDAYMQCNDVRRFGACALELCYLAAGTCDLYFEYHVQPWDYSAAYLILEEAGGKLAGKNGAALGCDIPTMLIGANNQSNLERLIAIVNKHLEN